MFGFMIYDLTFVLATNGWSVYVGRFDDLENDHQMIDQKSTVEQLIKFMEEWRKCCENYTYENFEEVVLKFLQNPSEWLNNSVHAHDLKFFHGT